MLQPLEEAINQAGVDMSPCFKIIIEVTWLRVDAFQKLREERQVVVMGFLKMRSHSLNTRLVVISTDLRS